MKLLQAAGEAIRNMRRVTFETSTELKKLDLKKGQDDHGECMERITKCLVIGVRSFQSSLEKTKKINKSDFFVML